jgi:DNA invertase Pin-like site-specific DNA recombinase
MSQHRPNWQASCGAAQSRFVRNRTLPYKIHGFLLAILPIGNTMLLLPNGKTRASKGITMNLRVVGYVRVSTEEQANSGVSLDAQKAKLTAYAALYGLEIVEIIEEAGQSAKSLKRPGLQRALAMLRRKEADGLLIAKLDRLSRSVKDWNQLIDSHFGEKAGKQLLSVADQIDTRTAAGRLVLNVLMSVAQWERETIGERTRDALHHKATKQERISRHLPFGWRLAEDGKLTEDASEQIILAEILQLRQAGHTLRKIAEVLNARNVTAKNGNRWIHTSIKSILNRNAA